MFVGGVQQADKFGICVVRMYVNMPGLLTVLLLFSGTLSSTLAQCTLHDMDCCLAEFSSMITPAGINLYESQMTSVCTFSDESIDCLDLFVDQCTRNESDIKDVEDLVNRTKAFISQSCPLTSDFMARLRENSECLWKSSTKFQVCYNKTEFPDGESDDEKFRRECCEYKALRNCAVQAVEDNCGIIASQLVHEEIVHTNGALLELTCSEVFNNCPNSAMMLVASSVFLILQSISVLKFLL